MKLGFFTMPMHPRRAQLHADAQGGPRGGAPGRPAGLLRGLHRRAHDRRVRVDTGMPDVSSRASRTTRSRSSSAAARSTCPTTIPAQIAAKVAMVDHMLEGRFIFGIGPGGLRSDQEVFGNLDLDRNAMFVESINQILALWAGEPPYNLKGKFWNIITESTLLPRNRDGRDGQALPEAASAHRGHRRRAAFEGRRGRGGPRLGRRSRRTSCSRCGRRRTGRCT